MKINKKQAMLIAGVACVVILILLLLTMCNGSGNTSAQNDTSLPATETVTETIQVSEATTEATEETTEETTEATEESTEPTTSGNTKPGGSGGNTSGSGGSNNQTTPEVKTPTPGSKDSPYMENITSFPDAVNTVEVPANGTVYYNLNLQDETVKTYGMSLLTIEDADATVIYNGKTYSAENGVVSVNLLAPETAGSPVTIQVSSKQKSSLTLNFDAPLGTPENPEEITWDAEGNMAVEASVTAKGTYYHAFTAEDDGTLTLKLDEITENADCDVIVTIGENEVDLKAAADMTYTVDVKAGETVTVQVKNNAEQGDAVAAEISGLLLYYGSKDNPIVVNDAFTSKEIAKGDEVYYQVTGLNGKVITISGQIIEAEEGVEGAEDTIVPTTAYIKLYAADGTLISTHNPDASGNAWVKIPNGTDDWLVSIGSAAEEDKTYDVTFPYAVGHKENPAALAVRVTREYMNVVEENGDNQAVIDAGDEQVYWYRWKNEVWSGLFDITMLDAEDWTYSVTVTKDGEETPKAEFGPYSSTDAVPQTEFQYLLSYGDVIDLWVYTDVAANEVQDSVNFHAEFTAHMLLNAYTATSSTNAEILFDLSTEAETTRYFSLVSKDANVTVSAEKAFTAVYNGVTYNSALDAGTGFYSIQVTKIEGETTRPDTMSVTINDGTATDYQIKIWHPLGSYMNPQEMGSAMTYANGGIKLGPEEEYYYRWIAPADGMLHFEIVAPTTVNQWKYVIELPTGEQKVGVKQRNGPPNPTHYEEEIVAVDVPVEAGGVYSIRAANPNSAENDFRTVRFKISYNMTVKQEPTAYTLTLGPGESLAPMDLTVYYEQLEADENGFCHVDTAEGVLILVDLNHEKLEGLYQWLKDNSIPCLVGESTTSTVYSDILELYLDCAQQMGTSDADKKLLYPLTADLMNIIKNFGVYQGWYDPESENYLFTGMTNLDEDSMWMFCCYYVSTEQMTLASFALDEDTDPDEKPGIGDGKGAGSGLDEGLDKGTDLSDPDAKSEPGTSQQTGTESNTKEDQDT